VQVPVRGGDDADVRVARPCAAEALELPFLEHAQQLRLDVGRHLADLVEKQDAAVGLLDPAGPRRDRAREGAAFVAKQLGLE
jgi:hypothetical protein